jgi:hypothetical protein
LCHIAISKDRDHAVYEAAASKQKNHKPGSCAGHIQRSTAQPSVRIGFGELCKDGWLQFGQRE